MPMRSDMRRLRRCNEFTHAGRDLGAKQANGALAILIREAANVRFEVETAEAEIGNTLRNTPGNGFSRSDHQGAMGDLVQKTLFRRRLPAALGCHLLRHL